MSIAIAVSVVVVLASIVLALYEAFHALELPEDKDILEI